MKKTIIVVAFMSMYMSIYSMSQDDPSPPIAQNAKDAQYQMAQLQREGTMQAIKILSIHNWLKYYKMEGGNIYTVNDNVTKLVSGKSAEALKNAYIYHQKMINEYKTQMKKLQNGGLVGEEEIMWRAGFDYINSKMHDAKESGLTQEEEYGEENVDKI